MYNWFDLLVSFSLMATAAHADDPHDANAIMAIRILLLFLRMPGIESILIAFFQSGTLR